MTSTINGIRTASRIALVIATALTLLLDPTPAMAATLELAPPQGQSPAAITVTGAMFNGLGDVSFFVDGDPAGTATPDAAFSVTLDLTITGPPGGVEISACQADATGSPCGVTATAVFTITAPPTTTSTTTTTRPPTTTSTRPPTTTTQAPTTTARPPTTTIATLPPITLPPVTMTTTTLGGLIVPGPGDDGGDGSSDPRPLGGDFLPWQRWIAAAGLVGAGVVAWWLRRRSRRNARDGVFDLPPEPTSGTNFPKLDTTPGSTSEPGKGGGNPETNWKVEKGERAKGKVFPKLEVDASSGPQAGKNKKKGNVEYGWKVEEAEKATPIPDDGVLAAPTDQPAAGKVFPKVEIDATATDQAGEVIPKLEIEPAAAGDGPDGADVLDLLDEPDGE